MFKIESENNSRPSVSSSYIFIYQMSQRDLLEFVEIITGIWGKNTF